MHVQIKPCLHGALEASGVVVIIDVFRAGNTVAACLQGGAPFVMPVSDLDEARALKQDNPDWLLAGEREGIKPDDFDLDNSPAAVSKSNLAGRPVILTTSAGTQGVAAAWPGSDALLMGTLLNARAVTDYIAALAPDLVTLVPIGLAGREPAVEDNVVARYLAVLLNGGNPDYQETASAMLKGPGADRLRRLRQGRDLAYCLRVDQSAMVPRAEMRDGRLVMKPVIPAS
jgi:2-phosphosulfolactate phosphatase